jgi:alginate O-acetyltransferase complex protein AlgI
MLGLLADYLERRTPNGGRPLRVVLGLLLSAAVRVLRVQLARLLVFGYVCVAWVFFRAETFDQALAVFRQLALLELDAANLVPLVTVPLAAGVVTHFFADGGYRWLRDRFCGLPAVGQGVVLALCGLAVRELAHPKIVSFIYFQF